MILEDENFLDSEFIERQIEEERYSLKLNKTRFTNSDYNCHLDEVGLNETSSSINNNSTVYVKKKMTKTASFKKY